MSEEAKPVCAYCRLPMKNGLADWHQTRHAKPTYCVDALRAALDQERADARRYRAWRDGCVHETSKVAVALAKCVWPSDYDAAIDALLSGRGRGDRGVSAAIEQGWRGEG